MTKPTCHESLNTRSTNMSITVNSKVFGETGRPGPTSILLTTTSRGITLPDTILIDHRVAKNPVEPGSLDKIHKVSFGLTFINADGVVKRGIVSKQMTIPDDMPQADIDLLMADLDDYEFSAKTVRTSVRAGLQAGILG